MSAAGPLTRPPRGQGAPPPPSRAATDSRARAWLGAAGALLLVMLFVVVELTYSSTHLPPPRYRLVEPGAVAHGPYADFRLLGLGRTERWGTEGGDPGSPEPGAVWVVARLEVTPRRHQDFLLCTMTLVSAQGRAWEPVSGRPSHEGESCAPEPEAARIGTTYPFVLGFEVPAADADRLAGLALETYSWRPSPLLRPPG